MTRRHSIASAIPASGPTGAVLVVVVVLFIGAVVVGSPVPDQPESDSHVADQETDAPETVVETVTRRDDGSVAVRFTTGTNQTRTFVVPDVDQERVDAAETWAYLPRSTLPAALTQPGDSVATGVGTVGPWALVGDLAVAREHEGRARVTVVAPAGMDVDPARKAGVLARFLAPYTFQPTGPADDRVTLFVAPDALPSDGLLYEDRGYISQHAFWDGDVGSVWVHEYVHAQQDFRLGPGMRWFREASATYLSYRVMEEQYGPVTETAVRDRLLAGKEYAGTALANRSAWTGSHANYDRGARLLYALDAAIRSGSASNRSVVDVVRRLNARDGPVTVGEFVRIVEQTAGTDVAWLRTAIVNPGALEDRVRNARSAFGE